MPPHKSFGLVLAGGGARGLAHIAVLEVLDDLGLRPAAIAGVSIGAALGAAYAAGVPAKTLRRHVLQVAHDEGGTLRRLSGARAAPLMRALRDGTGNPLALDAEKFAAAFLPADVPETFEALTIPLHLAAVDLVAGTEVTFSAGPLHRAVAASMALPGLIQPLRDGGRLLVDGAALNPVPCDLLRGCADVIVAVEPAATPLTADDTPGPWTTLFATLQVMGTAVHAGKRDGVAPDLVLRPPVGMFRLLDFLQASAILRAAAPVKEEARAALRALLAPG